MPCMKAGRSSGVRLVTRLPSRTQAASCQIPPAFSTSSRMAKKPVTLRPFRHFAEQSIQGPWQIAARTLPCLRGLGDQVDHRRDACACGRANSRRG